jgi:malate synthase
MNDPYTHSKISSLKTGDAILMTKTHKIKNSTWIKEYSAKPGVQCKDCAIPQAGRLTNGSLE